MKKIVLGCAAVLLSLGLLAGCNNDQEGTVTITVDNAATVVVGESLEVPYTVEPEKAKVEVLNDHEEYVTATAKKGVLSLEGVAAGDATITLVGTYKKYTEANVDIKVSVVTEKDVDTEPGIEGATTYKLGALYSAEYTYKYFDGTAYTTSSSHFLNVTEEWGSAANVYVAAIEDDGVDNSFTMSFYDSGDLKYIGWSSSTAVEISTEPYTWVWDATQELIVTNESTARFLALYSGASIRAYEVNDTNLTNPHVTLFETKPADPELPAVPDNLEQVTSLTSGNTYYLGEFDGERYHLVTGEMSGYYLATSIDFNEAAPITITGNDNDGWTLTLEDESVIYGYVSGTFVDFGIGSTEDVTTANGVSTFAWNTTIYTFTSSSLSYTYNNTTYSNSYFEYRNNTVQLYGSNDLSSVTNAAHLYQVVDSGDQPA